jgi:hypothetical protein
MFSPEIVNAVTLYFIIGFIWLLFIEFILDIKMNDNTRIRYFVFWPFTLGAFIMGVIEYLRNKDED